MGDSYNDMVTPTDWVPTDSIIKVIGVGGGGCNAVTYMYNQHIEGCTFIVCNTDRQSLTNSNVPIKIQLGAGRGAGTNPVKGRNAAIEAEAEIEKKVFTPETEMLFITAGMGGGTGTGAAPVIASMAKKKGILTVAVVTLPFKNEGNESMSKAVDGIRELENNVDSLLIINNEKLYSYYGDLLIQEAFPKADQVLATAVRGVVDIIQSKGFVNVDFEDVKAVNSIAKENFPGLPLALFGHSMGSMAVRSYVKRYDDTVDTLIVCGSPSHNPGAGFAKFLTKVYSILTGDRHRPSLIQHLAFGTFNRNFGKVTSPNAWVCSDPEIVRKYDSDPLCNFQFTNDGFINLFSLMQDAYDTENWALHNPQMPVLFISGADDPCLGPKAGFRKAVHAMQKAGYRNVGSILYPDMRHEILNEPDRMKVWDDILDFAGKSLP